MSELIESNSTTITSLEISIMTGKEHKNVLADCRKMLEELEISTADFSAVRKAANGKQETYFNLPKRECLILASGYSISLRAKIIDRWAELESNAPTHKIPQTLSEALQLAADQAKQIELQSEEIELAKPKVEFVNKYVDSSGRFNLTQAAKNLKFKRKDLIECLIRDGRIFRRGKKGKIEPYVQEVNRGIFEIKTGSTDLNHAFSQMYITAKGMNWLADTYASELGE